MSPTVREETLAEALIAGAFWIGGCIAIFALLVMTVEGPK